MKYFNVISDNQCDFHWRYYAEMYIQNSYVSLTFRAKNEIRGELQ